MRSQGCCSYMSCLGVQAIQDCYGMGHVVEQNSYHNNVECKVYHANNQQVNAPENHKHGR